MTITSKYIVLKNSGKVLLDFDLRFEDLNFYDQNILFSGSNQIDGIRTLPGTSFDFSNSKSSSDVIKLSGNLSDYIAHFYIDASGIINLSKGIGENLEAVSFISAKTASDTLIFNDYTTNASAIRDVFYTGNSVEKIYINSTLSEILLASNFDSNGNLDIFLEKQENITWVKVNPTVNKTLVLIDGSVSAAALAEAIVNGTTPALNIADSSVGLETVTLFTTPSESKAEVNDTALVKAIAFDQTGENFTGFGQNVTLNVSGNSGVDKVYIKKGSVVDATNLKGSMDEIYFAGTWDEYDKVIDKSGNITFSRTVSIDGNDTIESVQVSNGSVIATRDMLIFADGSLTTKDAFTAIKTSTEVLSKDISVFNNTITTPQLAPQLTTSLEEMKNKVLDVRSDIVFKIDQPVSAVEGKTITLTDNTAVGYQGETNNNSFVISVTSPALTIDNENGLIILDIDTLFDLDLSSSYTLSVDTGAFATIDSGIPTEAFSDITFNTVNPISGSDSVALLANMPSSQNSFIMDPNTGDLKESSTWISIEGLGNGSLSGNLNTISEDITAGNVFQIDAATGTYVFVFSDKNPDGFSLTSGSGVSSATDFAVYLENLGADDRIYIDDANNNSEQTNIIGFDFFTYGNGAVGSELYWGGSGALGDPRIYVNLENNLTSENGQEIADSSLLGVNKALGLDSENSLVTSDSVPILVNLIEKITLSNNGTNIAKQGDNIKIVASLSESFVLNLNGNTPSITLDFSGTPVKALYVSDDPSTKSITFSAKAPAGDTSKISLSSIDLAGSTIVGIDSGLNLSEKIINSENIQFVLDNTAASLTTTTLSVAENSISVGTVESDESATVTLADTHDSELFTLDDGVLTLKDAQDFESGVTSLTVDFDLVDRAGNTSTDSIIVNITDVNEAPISTTIEDQTAIVGKVFNFDIKPVFTDLDANDELTFSVTGDLPDGITLVDGVLVGTATDAVNTSDITITATDTDGLTSSQSFGLRAVNLPKVTSIDVKNGETTLARSGETLTVVLTLSESFEKKVSGTDMPIAVLNFGDEEVTATYVSDDPNAATLTFSVVAPESDATSVTLTSISLNDVSLFGANSNQALDTSKVGQSDTGFVLDNTAASLTTTTLSVAENSISVGTVESDESATLTLADTHDSELFTLEDGVLTLKDTQDFESGVTSLTVDFDLVDRAGNTSTDSIIVNITDVNEAPVTSVLSGQSGAYNQYFSLDISTYFSDVDVDDVLNFSIVGNLPTGLNLENGVISGVPTVFGDDLKITVKATDIAGLSVDNTFSVNITGEPIITTDLANLGSNMLDVRSSIVLKVNQKVTAVEGKNIVFIDNTDVGYQGETQQNNFTVSVISDLVTIDNDKGLITIKVDENFTLDLSSTYTMTIDDGAFEGIETGLASAVFEDINFNTVTPTSGKDNLSNLGNIDEDATIANYLASYISSAEGTKFASEPIFVQLGLARLSYNLLTESEQSEFHIQSTAAQSYMMSSTDGSLVQSAQWVDIESLGSGINSGNVATLDDDIEAGNVFSIDASNANYVFVFSDQEPSGASELTGAGIFTNTDFSVFLENFGSDDFIFVDDAFNNSDALNALSYEFFTSGSGGDTSELFVGLSNVNGDPRLYVGLADNLASVDEDGFADSSIEAVSETLGHDAPDEFIITA